MTLNEGDVVRFDYVLRVEGENGIRETSMRDVAEKEGLLVPERRYEPLTVTIGGRQIIPGLEEELLERGDKGAEFTADIPADKAYGPRDASKLKDIPMAQFRKQGVKPEVGLILNYEGNRAVITRVAGGRVRLDMNHELAGKSLRYEVKVTEVVTDDKEKAAAVLQTMFSLPVVHHWTDDGLEVELPDQAKFDQEWPMHKFRLLTQLRQAIGLDVPLRLVEVYPAMKPAEEEE